MANTARKIVVTTLAAVMLLGMVGLTGCAQSDLAAYKEAAVTTIETYADAKIAENSYTAEGLVAIQQAVDNGKAAVDEAKDKDKVDEAVNDAKKEVDGVLPENLKNQIKADYLEEYGRTFYYTKFYGLYGDSAVFFIESDDFGIKDIIIAGERFSASSQWTILVWNKGLFYNLENIEDVFEAGILTKTDLTKIAIVHANAN